VQVDILLEFWTLRRVRAGDCLCLQGKLGNFVFVIASGLLHVHQRDDASGAGGDGDNDIGGAVDAVVRRVASLPGADTTATTTATTTTSTTTTTTAAAADAREQKRVATYGAHVDTLGVNRMCGEFSLMYGAPRNATVIAAEDR
jgi:CRP-like cAMP-binding protein